MSIIYHSQQQQTTKIFRGRQHRFLWIINKFTQNHQSIFNKHTFTCFYSPYGTYPSLLSTYFLLCLSNKHNLNTNTICFLFFGFRVKTHRSISNALRPREQWYKRRIQSLHCLQPRVVRPFQLLGLLEKNPLLLFLNFQKQKKYCLSTKQC